MKITKERKILMAVAGVACTVFLADRVLMGGAVSGPQSAAAAATTPAPADNAAEALAVAPTPDALAAALADSDAACVPSLAERLDQARAALPAETPDAFIPSGHWQQAAAVPTENHEEVTFDAKAFRDRFPLDAVFSARGQARAMVAGRSISVGESRDGMTLTQIGDRWVIWTGHRMQVKVHLDPAAVAVAVAR